MLIVIATLAGCAATPQAANQSRWTEFVRTQAHANPIPKGWVATPEGRFAHDLVIPNPVPSDAGYREGMSSVEYYQRLCATEAGEFSFKTASNVAGIYFARPPAWPTDDDLRDRWTLEHPLVESKYQLGSPVPSRRAVRFVNPPFTDFLFYEEPNQQQNASSPYLQMSGLRNDVKDKAGILISEGAPMVATPVTELRSRYGLIWRGIHRPQDRENGIAGGEVIIYNLQSKEVLYVYRNFAFSGRTRATPDGIWWLTSGGCRQVHRPEDWPGAHALAVRARQVLKSAE